MPLSPKTHEPWTIELWSVCVFLQENLPADVHTRFDRDGQLKVFRRIPNLHANNFKTNPQWQITESVICYITAKDASIAVECGPLRFGDTETLYFDLQDPRCFDKLLAQITEWT